MVFYYSARAARTNLDIDEISSYEMEEKIGSGGDLSAKVALGSNSTGASYKSSSENTKKWQQNVSLEEKLNNALNKDKKYGKVSEKITDINEETKFIKINCNLDYGVMPFWA
ncbi:hypothetical protein [Rothia nasimurium]|uniref:hypothetical protein n=1 Tax=Rothia nasimurium TaxID=85336 RepID=UPI00117BB7F1|nr:hypothetical protein [Rothia nasimurium]